MPKIVSFTTVVSVSSNNSNSTFVLEQCTVANALHHTISLAKHLLRRLTAVWLNLYAEMYSSWFTEFRSDEKVKSDTR